ncbi:MAG TPA: histidinol-phosphate transaminase [Gemmatimonadales bacterium]|nr:histidinol-phosphate transaminase [Gemmatimonadales bacterium]
MALVPAALRTADDALALIKPKVRAQSAYTLNAPSAARKLNQNESPYDVPPAIKDAVLARVRELSWNRYPAFSPESLLERLARRHDWTAEGVLVGNGSNELIQASLMVSVGEGIGVVTSVPTFTLYRLMTEVLGGRHIGVPLTPDFQFDVDALLEAASGHGARVVVVNTPNNPTGTPIPDGVIERLLAETETLVLVDEAYQDFGGPSAIPLLPAHPRLIVLRTFSKAMALAGLRFGYALAHPTIAREITKAKLPYNLNQVTLAAAEVALDNPAPFVEVTDRIRAARDRLYGRLARIRGLRAFPSAANFVLVRCEARPAADVFRRLVEDYGILIRDVSAGQGLANCLRVTAGTPDDVDAVAGAFEAIFGTSP